ncbi:hypothetical protein B0H12DRAFT_343901 [Mycena haematopus]|nr:hypothetical protein B0H12DRAFT_343901 [Mycena haematopus]
MRVVLCPGYPQFHAIHQTTSLRALERLADSRSVLFCSSPPPPSKFHRMQEDPSPRPLCCSGSGVRNLGARHSSHPRELFVDSFHYQTSSPQPITPTLCPTHWDLDNLLTVTATFIHARKSSIAEPSPSFEELQDPDVTKNPLAHALSNLVRFSWTFTLSAMMADRGTLPPRAPLGIANHRLYVPSAERASHGGFAERGS